MRRRPPPPVARLSIPEANGSPDMAGCERALSEIERELRGLEEKVANVRQLLNASHRAPNELFSLLAAEGRRFMTVEDLGEILRVDRRTIYGLRSKGLLAHRVGKELRFDPLEVAEFLRKRSLA